MNAFLLLSMTLAAPPTELAMVPTDSVALVHVRGKELWKSELFTGFRQSIEAAGPKALAAYDESFYPNPSSIDSATVFVVPPEGGRGMPAAIGILTFDKAIDVEKVRSLYCAGESKTATGKSIYPMKDGPLAFCFPDDKHIVLSIEPMLEQFLTHKAGAPNRFIASAIEKASSGTKLVACVTSETLKLMPRDARKELQNMPAEFQALVQLQALTVTFDPVAGQTKFAVFAQYKDDTAALDAETAAKKAMAMALDAFTKMKPEFEAAIYGKPGQKLVTPRPLEDLPQATASLYALGTLQQFEEWMKNPPFVRKGDSLAVECTFKNDTTWLVGYSAIGVGLLLPAVQKVREAAARMQGQNNLKQIALAVHSYADAYGVCPAQSGDHIASGPADPRKRLSWRVYMLPYLEHDELFKKFKLDEPWDSEHNKKLIPLMPKVYMDPALIAEEGKTYYKGIAGKEGFFTPEKGRKFASITDGLSNTLMVVAAGKPVIWTAPEDFEFDSKKPVPDFSLPGRPTNVLFGDGSVQVIDFKNVVADKIKALCTCAGGEVVDRIQLENHRMLDQVAPNSVPKN